MKEQIANFFDRDGVVNLRIVGDYVRSPAELHLLPDICFALQETRKQGRLAILITNQQGIGRQLFSEKDLERVHLRLQNRLFATCGTNFDHIYVCPHLAEANCDCRKPKPGMLLQAKADLDVNLEKSWLIGDSTSDIAAGKSAGTKTAWVISSYDRTKIDEEPDVRGTRLVDLFEKINRFDRSV